MAVKKSEPYPRLEPRKTPRSFGSKSETLPLRYRHAPNSFFKVMFSPTVASQINKVKKKKKKKKKLYATFPSALEVVGLSFNKNAN